MLGSSLLMKPGAHCCTNHLTSSINTTPSPKFSFLEASQYNSRILDLELPLSKSINGLLKLRILCDRKIFHMAQSLINCLSNQIWTCCLRGVPCESFSFSLEYIPLVNARPGKITQLRKLRIPVSCCTCLIITFQLTIDQSR